MSGLYASGRQAFLDGEVSWSNDDIAVVLLSADYIEDLSTDEFLSDIPEAARVDISQYLTTKTSSDGVADADGALFYQVSETSPNCVAVAIFHDTGDPDTSQLIAFIDESPDFPVVPTGGNIRVVWSDAATKIFRL